MNEYLVGIAGILIGVYSGYKLKEVLSKKEHARSKIEESYETVFNYREAIVSHLINMARYIDSTSTMASIYREDLKVDDEQKLFFRLKRYVFFNNHELMDHFKEIDNTRKKIMQLTTEVMIKKPHWKPSGREETETLTKYKIYLDSLNVIFDDMGKKLETKYKKYI